MYGDVRLQLEAEWGYRGVKLPQIWRERHTKGGRETLGKEEEEGGEIRCF